MFDIAALLRIRKSGFEKAIGAKKSPKAGIFIRPSAFTSQTWRDRVTAG
jgi:hypothetical protein